MLAVKGRYNGATVVLESIPNSSELGTPINECEVIVNFPDISSQKPVNHSAFGRLKAYANPSLIPEEKGAWEKAAAEKHALH